MKLKYLGTAAAEGIPAIFCDCEVCKTSKKLGGKNIKTRSQAIIDNKLLIDFPPDTYMHTLYGGLKLEKIHSLLITHSHSDHLCPAEFEMRCKGFAHLEDETPLTVYSSEKTSKSILEVINQYSLDEQARLQSVVLKPFITVTIENYKITPLKADHDEACDPYIYIIDDGAKSMLYAHDTGIFLQETWDYLENNNVYFDFVSIDCTGMNLKGITSGHMCLESNVIMKKRFMDMGIADEKTIFCVNHFSHNGELIHDQLEEKAKKLGFLASYDNMEIEF